MPHLFMVGTSHNRGKRYSLVREVGSGKGDQKTLALSRCWATGCAACCGGIQENDPGMA